MSISIKQHDHIHSSQTHNQDLNMKATELRLGLPGSESPERSINGGMKSLVAGAKRGYSDTKGGVDSSLSSPKVVYRALKWIETCKSKQVGWFDRFEIIWFGCNVLPVVWCNGSVRAQVVGWPPIRSFRKNSMTQKNTKNEDDPNAETVSHIYVKVSMDGAPYLRKVDLKTYSSYLDLSLALATMFSTFTLGQHGSESRLMDLLNGYEYVLTYEDKDGDLMLVGDVPWYMFTGFCKRMRIMKSSDAIGLAPRAVEECRSDN
ncbi:auxin-responsive protein IAA27-like [Bidens hawaiensis]|uniref:auxin-responsive protein IAA27-like n=1 Tax=Bidens hawaiensis TaxID=980011 RepID=UPI00404B44D7